MEIQSLSMYMKKAHLRQASHVKSVILYVSQIVVLQALLQGFNTSVSGSGHADIRFKLLRKIFGFVDSSKAETHKTAEAIKTETTKADAKPEMSVFGTPRVPRPAAAPSKRRMLGRRGWESDTIYAELVPMTGQPGTHASDPASKAIDLFMALDFKHPMKGCTPSWAAFHQ